MECERDVIITIDHKRDSGLRHNTDGQRYYCLLEVGNVRSDF